MEVASRKIGESGVRGATGQVALMTAAAIVRKSAAGNGRPEESQSLFHATRAQGTLAYAAKSADAPLSGSSTRQQHKAKVPAHNFKRVVRNASIRLASIRL